MTIPRYLLMIPYLVCNLLWGQNSLGISKIGVFADYKELPRKDVYGYTDAEGREFVFYGIGGGISIVDVTNAKQPREVTFIASPTSIAKDVKTFKHYAYIVSDPEGTQMQIVDLSGLPDTAVELTPYNGDGFAASHNIWIDTVRALMYATGPNGVDCRILSLNDPLRPDLLGYISVENHDMYGIGDLLYVPEGRNNAVSIYNVANPTEPNFLVQIPFPASGPTYVHTVRTTADQNYMITSEEVADKTVKLWDISNYDSIRVIDEYMADDDKEAIGHDIYFIGKIAYMSYYKRGIRVFDLTPPISLKEVAYYHEPGNNVWGIYTFPSGKIVGSDAMNGLVIYELEDKTLLDSVGSTRTIKTTSSAAQNFNLSASQSLKLSLKAPVTLTVSDVRGQIKLHYSEYQQGLDNHTTIFNISSLGNGIYYYQAFQSGNRLQGSLQVREE